MKPTTKHIHSDVVKNLREIRDQINTEIMNMSFEDERLYLDKLLKYKKSRLNNKQKRGAG